MAEAVIRPAGDSGLLVEFEDEISLEVNARVRALKFALEESPFEGMGDLLPAYRSLLVCYDPLRLGYSEAGEKIRSYLSSMDKVSLPKAIVTEIPVCYDREYGIDLEHIAELENKSEEEVIRIHSQSDYFVYMLGFAPGHPYSARFENPFSFKRMENPRLKIPAGSIVVQLALSDIIPFDQPCGWNIIGSTPVLACDYRKENPFLLRAGQWIRHRPVSKEEYLDIKKQAEAGTYVCRTWEKED